MKIFTLISFVLLSLLSFGQVDYTPCYTMENMEKRVKENPSLNNIEAIDYQLNKFSENYVSQRASYVIPVVFHVIHQNGAENISKEQIEDQIRIINEDFSRTNPDADETPEVFAAVAGIADIEFRLANIDPNGNCTEGIVRVESPLTYGADDNVKSVSYWPSENYLNVWVVNSIDSDPGGVTLGYAQFPGFGDPLTDGLVIRYDCIGSIEEALTPVTGTNYQGRTMTHEAGHWLGLRHIWGDSNCGDDWVDDTPPAASNNSGCPTFPHDANACSGTGPDGEMFMNFMDYSTGGCQNMFSAGQADRMKMVLDNIRTDLHTSTNLSATGTDDLVYDICAPIAGFGYDDSFLCEGDSTGFYDQSWNGTPDNFSWSFEGGSPATSEEEDPIVVYESAGVYGVSLTVDNAQGSDTKSSDAIVYVSTNQAMFSDWHYAEHFDEESNMDNWIFLNDNDNGWEWTNQTSAPWGTGSMYIHNHSGNASGSVDVLISPSFDLTTIGSPKMYFDIAYAKKGNASEDRLKIYISTDCGKTWILRYNKTGDNLATTSNTTANFVPDMDEWEEHVVNFAAYGDEPNARVKFEFESSGGNNIWIDNINITDINSTQEMDNALNTALFPNPSKGELNILINNVRGNSATVEIVNALGQQVYLNDFVVTSGKNQFQISLDESFNPGIYWVKVTNENGSSTMKLLIQ